jgi:hypothetical protein
MHLALCRAAHLTLLLLVASPAGTATRHPLSAGRLLQSSCSRMVSDAGPVLTSCQHCPWWYAGACATLLSSKSAAKPLGADSAAAMPALSWRSGSPSSCNTGASSCWAVVQAGVRAAARKLLAGELSTAGAVYEAAHWSPRE